MAQPQPLLGVGGKKTAGTSLYKALVDSVSSDPDARTFRMVCKTPPPRRIEFQYYGLES
jgi:hypothetical protein